MLLALSQRTVTTLLRFIRIPVSFTQPFSRLVLLSKIYNRYRKKLAFQIIKSNHGNVVILAGEIDMDSSRIAREAILASLEDGHNTLVDMSAVVYIDSSGVATLIEGFQSAKERRLEFGLVGISSFAMDVLKMARLDKVFKIYESIDELA